MTTISIVLGIILTVYTVLYTFSRLKPIKRYNVAKEASELKKISATVVEKNEHIIKYVKGEKFDVCLPKYVYEIDGQKRYYQSSVKCLNVEVGQVADMEYCERTGEVWITTDIPLMKRDLKIRVPMILFLLVLLILTETVI